MKAPKRHLYHILDASPWPIAISFNLFNLIISFVLVMNRVKFSLFFFLLNFLILLILMYLWWRDVVREATFQGHHTLIVKQGLIFGFILFIISEIMFFFGFFWAFFHSSLSPTIAQGFTWPPIGINILNPLAIPLLNTTILLVSSISITWVHSLLKDNRNIVLKKYFNYINNVKSLKNITKMDLNIIVSKVTNEIHVGFLITIFLALFFTILQLYEYFSAPITILDGIFGSVFFSLTGLHGLHVIIGTIFISVCYIRFNYGHFTEQNHLGLEFAAWYWHFVDVVWLFLYIFVYWWSWL